MRVWRSLRWRSQFLNGLPGGSLWLAISVGASAWAQTLPGRVYPAATWATRTPEQLGLAREKLAALQELVGGRGCVMRAGFMAWSWGDQQKSSDLASAFKPLLSTLLFIAIQEEKLSSVDDKVTTFEPRLADLNEGKDATVTWRHLASQTSGYGLADKPGAAYSYNDYALALYFDTLTQKVFQEPATQILRTRLAAPLQFEDSYTFQAFGSKDRPGRLALSVRDFCRFGLLYLRNGQWGDRQVVKKEWVEMALNSPLRPDFPRTSGQTTNMLPQQRTIGGNRNITPIGPGFYSFNWWLNRTNALGQSLFPEAPPDTFVASGHGGMRMLWIIPRLDLVVCWNDSKIDDQDRFPGQPKTKCNQAARLMVEAAEAKP